MVRTCAATAVAAASCEFPRFDMMHTSFDGKRMYVSNSILSTLDHAGRFYVRLVHIGPDGMKVDPFFNVDLNHLKTGPARGHDMLLN
jgi:selenium-binding protein 1